MVVAANWAVSNAAQCNTSQTAFRSEFFGNGGLCCAGGSIICNHTVVSLELAFAFCHNLVFASHQPVLFACLPQRRCSLFGQMYASRNTVTLHSTEVRRIDHDGVRPARTMYCITERVPVTDNARRGLTLQYSWYHQTIGSELCGPSGHLR